MTRPVGSEGTGQCGGSVKYTVPSGPTTRSLGALLAPPTSEGTAPSEVTCCSPDAMVGTGAGASAKKPNTEKSSPPFCATTKPPPAAGAAPFGPPPVSAITVRVPVAMSTRCRVPSETLVHTSEPSGFAPPGDESGAHQTGPSPKRG